MNPIVLVTDSLFIYPQHEALLADAGFTVRRIDKPKATEEELIAGLRGAVGYILGGIETVTANVILNAPDLRAIAFTGSGYHEFIPGVDEATQRGIAITAAVGGNATAVAEFTLSLTLLLVRHLSELLAPGPSTFMTVRSFKDTTVGIVGFGNIGKAYKALLDTLGFRVLVVDETDPQDGRRLSLADVLTQTDIISLHVSKARGTNVLGQSELELLKDGAAIINCAFDGALDVASLAPHLHSGRLYYATDCPSATALNAKPGHYIHSNAQTGFNVSENNQIISERATKSLINVLRSGSDDYIVNPSFRHNEQK